MLQPYDVLQIKTDGRWRDLSTLRTVDEMDTAVLLVHVGRWNDAPAELRVVRNSPVLGTVILPATLDGAK